MATFIQNSIAYAQLLWYNYIFVYFKLYIAIHIASYIAMHYCCFHQQYFVQKFIAIGEYV